MAGQQQIIDIVDPPWRDVKAWANERLEMHRRGLEQVGLSVEDTEGARYAIAELKALLNFAKPSKIAANLSEQSE